MQYLLKSKALTIYFLKKGSMLVRPLIGKCVKEGV